MPEMRMAVCEESQVVFVARRWSAGNARVGLMRKKRARGCMLLAFGVGAQGRRTIIRCIKIIRLRD
jgi:hypothetical protein